MMDITVKSEFTTGGRLWLVDNVFDVELFDQINLLFVGAENNPDWQVVPEFAHRPGRLIYRGTDPAISKIDAWARTNTDTVSKIFGTPVKLISFDLWYDIPGYRVSNHVDMPETHFGMQVYMGKPTMTWQMLGTCFNRKNGSPLFEAHYTPNSAYMIERPDLIWHSLNHNIPDQYRRMHIYFRFNPV